MKAQDRKDKVA
jgi:hypothetical protein